jgi:hypothetical protein
MAVHSENLSCQSSRRRSGIAFAGDLAGIEGGPAGRFNAAAELRVQVSRFERRDEMRWQIVRLAGSARDDARPGTRSES